ncbi:PepSY domain-containing protein [Cesiribacter sp. SM1]|uniref:PepSY domain-containing protein n=1 Tax=Cesiribacter sp. SM1 TaxID=2861196 RepID=UPI001CD54E21|nr:PepSY domain-containing protein [Cesiribacter sp. SM1]
MRYLILLVCLVLSQNIFAQRIKTQQVLKAADSILKSRVGDVLFKMFQVSEGSYHTYLTSSGREVSGKFLSKKKLRKSTESIHVLYHFNYPDIEGIRGGSWIILDDKLKPTNSIDLAYIPDFVKKKNPSTFLEKERASRIAQDSFKENGVRATEPELRFEQKYGKYIYQINNILTSTISPGGQETGQMEIAEVDAETGEVLAVYNGVYGLIIR